MAKGDVNDMLARLKSLVPSGWFSTKSAAIRDALFAGLAAMLAWIYRLLQAVVAATRVASTTGWLLDLVAWDFFNAWFVRRPSEGDDQWRRRFVAEIFRERVTRKGILGAIADLTGVAGSLLEPWNPNDTAAYGQSFYGQALYGSLALPCQIFVNAHRPRPQGIANVQGYSTGFYGAPPTAYVSLAQVTGQITDAEIYRTVKRNKASGITAWVAIS